MFRSVAAVAAVAGIANAQYSASSYTVTTTASATSYSASATPSCAAPGAYDSQGRYSCNPAHQYPAGQNCVYVDGCPVLIASATTTSASYSASSTPSCVPAGSYDSKGRYSCNLAHQYPAGNTCQVIDGCPLLVIASSSASYSATSASSYSASSSSSSATPSCVPAGSYDSKGRYSCNPAHQYPAGNTCQFIDGCPLLVISGTGYSSTTLSPATTTAKYNATGPTTTTVPYTGGAAVTKAMGGAFALVAGVIAFAL